MLKLSKEDQKNLAKEMFENGKSYAEISKDLDISESTLKSWKRRAGWERATLHTKKTQPLKKDKKVANKKNVRKDDVSIEKIKENLISQLKKRKADEEVYRDLVDDYVAMWNIKNQLIEDINMRGVQVKTFNSNGQEVYKKNDSIVELPKYNTQMLKLLNDLGLSALDWDSEAEGEVDV